VFAGEPTEGQTPELAMSLGQKNGIELIRASNVTTDNCFYQLSDSVVPNDLSVEELPEPAMLDEACLSRVPLGGLENGHLYADRTHLLRIDDCFQDVLTELSFSEVFELERDINRTLSWKGRLSERNVNLKMSVTSDFRREPECPTAAKARRIVTKVHMRAMGSED
jgi:hypothetical protein